MKILKVTFGSIYSWYDDPVQKQKAIEETQARADLVERIVGKPDVEAGTFANYNDMILSQNKYFQFIEEGIIFDKVTIINIDDGADCFNKVAEKSNATPSPSQSFNQLVQVHVAGQALSTYNNVKLLEDSCTDILKDEINKGWRIIACCVQPDQRRPDYILGKCDHDARNG